MIRPLFACLLLGLSLPGHGATEWNWSGFASFGGGQLNRDDLHFIDYDNDWSVNSDTVAGLQLQANLTERWAFTTQIVAEGYYWDDTQDFTPQLDWLFLSHALRPDLRLRLGRMRSPHYLFSETLNVGYSYPWVRPPADVYAFVLAPFSTFDGLDLTWNTDLQGTELDIQILGGVNEGEFAGLDIDVTPLIGANLTLHRDTWLLRYGLLLHNSDIDNAGGRTGKAAMQQLAAIDPLFTEVADAFTSKDDWYQYHALGGEWDLGNWTLLGEGFRIVSAGEGFSNDNRGWYLSVQYHWDRLSPYLVAGHYLNCLNEHEIALLENSFTTYPPGSLGPAVDQLRYGTLQRFRDFYAEERTWTLGLRFDALANLSIKGEIEYFDFIGGSTGHMIPSPGAARPNDAMLTSIIIDLVF